MYTFIREASFKTMADAVRGMPVATAIARFYKETTGMDVQLMRPISGSPLRIRFIGDFDSLDKWQENQAKVVQDPAFHNCSGNLPRWWTAARPTTRSGVRGPSLAAS